MNNNIISNELDCEDLEFVVGGLGMQRNGTQLEKLESGSKINRSGDLPPNISERMRNDLNKTFGSTGNTESIKDIDVIAKAEHLKNILENSDQSGNPQNVLSQLR